MIFLKIFIYSNLSNVVFQISMPEYQNFLKLLFKIHPVVWAGPLLEVLSLLLPAEQLYIIVF